LDGPIRAGQAETIDTKGVVRQRIEEKGSDRAENRRNVNDSLQLT